MKGTSYINNHLEMYLFLLCLKISLPTVKYMFPEGAYVICGWPHSSGFIHRLVLEGSSVFIHNCGHVGLDRQPAPPLRVEYLHPYYLTVDIYATLKHLNPTRTITQIFD